jgi:CheY-like chemotaxis protein
MQMRGIGEVETFFLHSRKEPARILMADGFPESVRSALIVDDDANTRDFISRRMNRHGWRVSVAANGIEGKDIAARYRFDLLITDCDMPGMDGFELTRHIRQLETGSSAPMRIIAVTGSDSSRSAQRCLDAGMDAFLRKPVAWSELGACIDRLFADAVPDEASSPVCSA